MKLHESWPERLSSRGCTEPQKCNKNGEAAATRNSIARASAPARSSHHKAQQQARVRWQGRAGFLFQSPPNRQGQCINFTGQSTHAGLSQARSLGSSRACRGALFGQHLLHRSSVEGLASCSSVFVPIWPERWHACRLLLSPPHSVAYTQDLERYQGANPKVLGDVARLEAFVLSRGASVGSLESLEGSQQKRIMRDIQIMDCS